MTQLSSPSPGVQIYHDKVKISGDNALDDDDDDDDKHFIPITSVQEFL